MALRDLVGRLLPSLDEVFPTGVLRELTQFLEEHAGAGEVSVWLADYDQDLLAGLSGPDGADVEERVAVGEGPVGCAYATQEQVTVAGEGGWSWVHTPITLRGDRIGVLRVGCPDRGGDPGELGRALVEVALVLAYVLSLAPRYTDVFERARRRHQLSVAAEMQWSVLPARAFTSEACSIAGALIPAYEVGGDVYDFAVEPDRLWVTAIDAMGHEVSASVLASLTSHTLRNARRRSADVVAQVHAADRALVEVFGGDQFVTAVVAEIDLQSGACRFVNAGHPSLLLARRDTVEPLARAANVPVGLFTNSTFAPVDTRLQPGDRLVIVSDGVVEALLDDDTQYGDTHLGAQILATRHHPPQAAVRALQRHLLHTSGDRLHDDATILVVDWHGPTAP